MTLLEKKKDFDKTYKDGKSYSKKQFKKLAKSKDKKKQKLTENCILGFIKSLVDKEFKVADEFIQKEVDIRIKKRISDTVKH